MKRVRFIAMMMVAIIVLAACAPAPTPTSVPTPVPPTPTPVPPTATAVPPTATPVPTVASSAASSAPTSAVPVAINVSLGAGRDGDQAGVATLTAKDNKTEVLLNIKPGAAGVAQPAHIHVGQCPVPGAVKYPLSNVVDGKSLTTLDVTLADLLAGGFAINVHLSAAEASKYVACGALPQGAVIKLDKGRDGDQSGIAVLIAQGAKTDVYLFIKPLPGVTQPAHIHEGACPVPGAVKYPLTSILDGKSKTTVEVTLADLLKGGLAINAHKSAAEASQYVACGDLKMIASAPASSAASSTSSGKEDTGYGK